MRKCVESRICLLYTSGKSRAKVYVVENGKIRLPYMAMKGLGESVANELERATMGGQQYLSAEELQAATGASSTCLLYTSRCV